MMCCFIVGYYLFVSCLCFDCCLLFLLSCFGLFDLFVGCWVFWCFLFDCVCVVVCLCVTAIGFYANDVWSFGVVGCYYLLECLPD